MPFGLRAFVEQEEPPIWSLAVPEVYWYVAIRKDTSLTAPGCLVAKWQHSGRPPVGWRSLRCGHFCVQRDSENHFRGVR